MPALELMRRGVGDGERRGWRAAWLQCAISTGSLAAVFAAGGLVSLVRGGDMIPLSLLAAAAGALAGAASGISPATLGLLAFVLAAVELLRWPTRREASATRTAEVYFPANRLH
jgi:hypothetical protein